MDVELSFPDPNEKRAVRRSLCDIVARFGHPWWNSIENYYPTQVLGDLIRTRVVILNEDIFPQVRMRSSDGRPLVDGFFISNDIIFAHLTTIHIVQGVTDIRNKKAVIHGFLGESNFAPFPITIEQFGVWRSNLFSRQSVVPFVATAHNYTLLKSNVHRGLLFKMAPGLCFIGNQYVTKYLIKSVTIGYGLQGKEYGEIYDTYIKGLALAYLAIFGIGCIADVKFSK